MKKLQTPLFLIFIGILLCAASCNKEEPDPPPDLPPLTNVGAMTFGCYVNGEPWVAEVPPFQAEFRHIGASLDTLKKRFLIFGTRWINNIDVHQQINLKLSYEELNELTNKGYGIDYSNQSYINHRDVSYKHELDTTYHNNYIKIVHFDIDKRIISGQFEMRAISTTTNDTIVIKDGRFDTIFSVIE